MAKTEMAETKVAPERCTDRPWFLNTLEAFLENTSSPSDQLLESDLLLESEKISFGVISLSTMLSSTSGTPLSNSWLSSLEAMLCSTDSRKQLLEALSTRPSSISDANSISGLLSSKDSFLDKILGESMTQATQHRPSQRDALVCQQLDEGFTKLEEPQPPKGDTPAGPSILANTTGQQGFKHDNPQPPGGASPADAAILVKARAFFKRCHCGEPCMDQDFTKGASFKTRNNFSSAYSSERVIMEPKAQKDLLDQSKQSPDEGERCFVQPTEKDVLMGRGGLANNNPGNKWYLEVKDNLQARYLATRDKRLKTAMSQELFDLVKVWGGRFVRQCEKTKQWYEVDISDARKKCSQALREKNTPEARAAKRARYSK